MATHIGRERKPLTVLFADVVDSTAMAEQMDPEDWAATMNKVFDLMARAVKKYEGTVAQFLGDGILAFFGAPLAHEDDPHRAVWAALHMLEETSKLATELEGSANLNLRIRIGINTGPAILGDVGNLEPGGYSAMGDTLNTAARVQSAAEPSTVALTERTFRLVAAAFDGEDLGEVEVKGKAAPVHLYRVTGPRTVDPATDSAGALSSPMVGREAQMGHLRQLVSAVGKGRGGVAFVIGEPGIGKSRLIREVRSSVSSQHPDLIWLEGRALSYGSSVPYRLVLQILRSLLGTGLATDPHEAAEIVAQVLENFVGPGASDTLPYLAHLLSIPVTGADLPENIEPEVLQQRYVDSLTSLFSSAANQQAIVIACDDLHWADASSAALLSKLLKIASHSRVLFIFSSRRQPQSAGWRLLAEARDSFGEALTEINLGPFSPAESAALAEQLLGGSPPDSLRNFVYEVTEGNPLFIEEVVRTYVCPDPSPGAGWNTRTRESLLESSSSLHSLLLASIDRLPEQAKRLLKVASVIGREFAVDVLEQVVQETDEPLDVARQVSALEAGGVVRISEVHPELQYSFRHSLLQEAAYGSLLKSERKRLHAAIGAALEKVYPQRTEELAGLLARHFGEAGEDERALSYSVLAADAAFSRYATSEAAIHYARAVDIATRSGGQQDRLAHLYLRLGRALELTDRYDEAVGIYQRLEELGKTRGARDLELAGLVAGATALVTPAGVQDIAESERLARRALELARRTGDRAAEGMSLWNLMMAHNFSGRDPALAIKFGEDALAIARQVGSIEQVASTLLDLHWAYLGNGQIERSAQALDEAKPLWIQLGDKVMLADSLTGSSGLKLFGGDLPGAIADAEQARSISEEAGNVWGQMSSGAYSGFAYLELDRPAEAIDVMRQCMRMAEEIRLAGLPGIRADLGLILVQTGFSDEGLALGQQAWDESLQGSAAKGWVATRLAKINLLMAKVDEAESLLQSIDPERDAGLFMPIPVKYPLGLVRAELALAKGAWEHCLSLSRTLAEELARLNFKFWLPEALLLQARASSALGEYDEAVRVLEKGQSLAEAMGATWSLRPIAALLNELNKMSKH